MMKKLAIGIFILVSITSCERKNGDAPELKQNTEEYFKAHGIVQGRANELRIGEALFRFPVGIGLNPYTAEGVPLIADGAGGRSLSEVPGKIVKGRADKVTFYLDAERDYAPGPDPFPTGEAVRVEISKNGAPAYKSRFERLIQDKPVVVEHPEFGLREYRSDKDWIGSIYESSLSQFRLSADGGKLFFGCQPSELPMSGLCGTSYWREDGEYSVSMAMDKSFFLKNWREAYPAVVSFVNSIVVK